jgi:hypothetical protein
VEHPGIEYMILLNDPELRDGLIGAAKRHQGEYEERSRPFLRLRTHVAHALHALAIRIEPPLPSASDSAPRQPAFVE